MGRETAYLWARPVLPSAPAAPPSDIPVDMAKGPTRALDFGRAPGSFAIGTCSLFRATQRSATYTREGTDGQTFRMHQGEKKGAFTDKNIDIPIWRGASGFTHYDPPVEILGMAIA